MIRAVLFDWGGTLTPFHDLDALELWRAAASVLAPARSGELAVELLAVEGESWAETVGACRSTRTSEILATACARLEIPLGDALHDDAMESCLSAWAPHTVARSESVPVLRALRSRGLMTGLLSNTHWPRAWHEEWLQRDGLLPLLDARVYTSELTHLKPHAVAFNALLSKMRVTAAESVFVGDRAIDDISGAAALGMRTVHLPSGLTPPGPVPATASLPDLTGLPALIASWTDRTPR